MGRRRPPRSRSVSDAAGARAARDPARARLGAGAQAHEVRPGYLELQQTGPETWDVLWKVPARGDLQLAIAPAWPDNCDVEGAPRRFATGGAATERSTIRCAGGLTGREVAVSGLSGTVIDVLVRLQRSDGTAAGRPSHPVGARLRGRGRAALDRGRDDLSRPRDRAHPARHRPSAVRPGDAAAGAFLASPGRHHHRVHRRPQHHARRWPPFGFVHVPPQPVEAAIALSIVFVAVEIVHGRMGRPGLTERWPWVVAFVFGLLHGLGFAARCARSACRKTPFRPPCCSSISAWSWASSPSSAWRAGAPCVASIPAVARAGVELAPRALRHWGGGDVLDDRAHGRVRGMMGDEVWRRTNGPGAGQHSGSRRSLSHNVPRPCGYAPET